MTKQRYLDLGELQPGDIVLTAEMTFTSLWLQFAQLILHPQYRTYRYSHAAIVLDNSLLFETTMQRGAMYAPISLIWPWKGTGAEIQDGEVAEFRLVDGKLCVLWNISRYLRFDVFRLPELDKKRISAEQIEEFQEKLIDVTLRDYLKKYTRPERFLGILHKSIRNSKPIQLLRRTIRRVSGNVRPAPFCSELTAKCLQGAGAPLFEFHRAPNSVDPSTLAEKSRMNRKTEMIRHDAGEQIGASKDIDLNGDRCAIPKFLVEGNHRELTHAAQDYSKLIVEIYEQFKEGAQQQEKILKEMKSIPMKELSESRKKSAQNYENYIEEVKKRIRTKKSIEISKHIWSSITDMNNCFGSCPANKSRRARGKNAERCQSPFLCQGPYK